MTVYLHAFAWQKHVTERNNSILIYLSSQKLDIFPENYMNNVTRRIFWNITNIN